MDLDNENFPAYGYNVEFANKWRDPTTRVGHPDYDGPAIPKATFDPQTLSKAKWNNKHLK